MAQKPVDPTAEIEALKLLCENLWVRMEEVETLLMTMERVLDGKGFLMATEVEALRGQIRRVIQQKTLRAIEQAADKSDDEWLQRWFASLRGNPG